MNSVSQRLAQAQPSVPQMSPEGGIGLQSHSIDQLVGAKARADTQLHNVRKGSANPFFKSDYADLAAITKIVRPCYGKNGMAFVQAPWLLDGKHVLITTLAHESGQWIRSVMPIDAMPDKNGVVTPQATGSAITYAKRYALAAMANLAQTDEDDDGEAAMGREAPPAPAPVTVDDIADTFDVPDDSSVMDESLAAVADRDDLRAWYRQHERDVHELKTTNPEAFKRIGAAYKRKESQYA